MPLLLIAAGALLSAVVSGCQGTGCLFAPAATEFVSPDYPAPVIVVTGFRPCPKGRAYERPIILRAIDSEGRLVKEEAFSGLADGINPLAVPVYLPEGYAGKTRVVVGECPPLFDEPKRALACEDVDWVRDFTVRVPAGEEGWRYVHDISLRRSECHQR